MKRAGSVFTAMAVGIIFAAMSMTFLSSANRRAGGDVVLHLPKRCLDLGTVTYRDTRSFSFSLVNKGTRRLVVNELDSECG